MQIKNFIPLILCFFSISVWAQQSNCTPSEFNFLIIRHGMLFEPFGWQAKGNTEDMQVKLNYENCTDEEGGQCFGTVYITVPYDSYLQRKLCGIANNDLYKRSNDYGDSRIIHGDYMIFNVKLAHIGRRFMTNVIDVKNPSNLEMLQREVCPLFEVVSYIAYKSGDTKLYTPEMRYKGIEDICDFTSWKQVEKLK